MNDEIGLGARCMDSPSLSNVGLAMIDDMLPVVYEQTKRECVSQIWTSRLRYR